MIKGKKGIVRIIESAIAVMIILGFVIFMQGRMLPRQDATNAAYRIQHQVLIEIESNQTMRNEIISGSTLQAENYIASRLTPYLMNFSTRICDMDRACLCSSLICPLNTNIYSDGIVVGANISSYNPRKFVMYTWFLPGRTPSAPGVTPPPSGGGAVCGDGACDSGSGENNANCPADCPIIPPVTICSPGALNVTWYGYYSTHACSSDAMCGNCKKTETCSSDGMSWTLTHDWNVQAETGDYCIGGKDENCNGIANDVNGHDSDCPMF